MKTKICDESLAPLPQIRIRNIRDYTEYRNGLYNASKSRVSSELTQRVDENMSSIFAVLFNEVPELEFDRSKPLPRQQEHFLDVMDKELRTQLVMGDEVINNPDMHERAQFVAINLVNALKSGDDGLAAAMCSYLALRVPDLKKVNVKDSDGQVVIDLVFDEDYVKQVNVEFVGRSPTKTTTH